MLIKIPFECAIKYKIIVKKKACVGEMNNTNKYYCIIFVELSLNIGLTYNFKTNAIDGLGTLEMIEKDGSGW